VGREWSLEAWGGLWELTDRSDSAGDAALGAS
jgi:hypothetical protein